MERVLSIALAMALTLAGCQQLPLSPEDLQAKKFAAVPDNAVIYLVRDSPDFSDQPATIRLGDNVMITTYTGTYYRWEVPPGAHRITGYAADIGTITLQAEAGRIYFVRQQRAPFVHVQISHFYLVSEPEGRAAVMRAVLLTGGS